MLAELHQREVSAPRPAADDSARRVRDAVLHQPLEAGVQVLQLRSADVADQRVTPLGAVPGRPAVVDHRHGEPGVDVGLRFRAPPILVQPGRPAVRPDQDRERPVALRRDVEAVHRLSVLVVEPERDVRAAARARARPRRGAPRRRGRPGCAARWRRSPSCNQTEPSGRTRAAEICPSGCSIGVSIARREVVAVEAVPAFDQVGQQQRGRVGPPVERPPPRRADRSGDRSRCPWRAPRSRWPPRRRARGSRRVARRPRPATTPAVAGSCRRRGDRRRSAASEGR